MSCASQLYSNRRYIFLLVLLFIFIQAVFFVHLRRGWSSLYSTEVLPVDINATVQNDIVNMDIVCSDGATKRVRFLRAGWRNGPLVRTSYVTVAKLISFSGLHQEIARSARLTPTLIFVS
jgi:hypothetical protein